MTLDNKVLEEIIELKDITIKTKDEMFAKLSADIMDELDKIEIDLNKENFFPPEIAKRVRELKTLLKLAR